MCKHLIWNFARAWTLSIGILNLKMRCHTNRHEWTGRGSDKWWGRVDWEGTRLLTRLTDAAVPMEDGRQIFANFHHDFPLISFMMCDLFQSLTVPRSMSCAGLDVAVEQDYSQWMSLILDTAGQNLFELFISMEDRNLRPHYHTLHMFHTKVLNNSTQLGFSPDIWVKPESNLVESITDINKTKSSRKVREIIPRWSMSAMTHSKSSQVSLLLFGHSFWRFYKTNY